MSLASVADSHRLALPLESFVLANGLRVVLQPDDRLGIAAVNVWYHVGSSQEDPQATGIAHLLEHLMFEGSAGYDGGYFLPLQEAGATVNGSTSRDRTNYYELVPSQFLERALWLESDRMGRLLEVLTPAKLETQRSVVINEREQRYDNPPYGRVPEILQTMLFCPGHGYSWPVIGWTEHLKTLSLEQIRDFWTRWYSPAQATLVISGSFDRDDVKRWIDEYFGKLPAREPSANKVTIAGPLRYSVRHEQREAVSLSRLDRVWLTVPAFHPDEPALDYLADVLAGRSKEARLKDRLVFRDKSATSVAAWHGSSKQAGQFGIRLFAHADQTLTRAELAVEDELARIIQSPPTEEELVGIRRQIEHQMFNQIQTVLGKADSIARDMFFGRPIVPSMLEAELARYHAVTAHDVQRVARQYLTIGSATVVVHRGNASRSTSAARIIDGENRSAEKFVDPKQFGFLPQGSTPKPFTLGKPAEIDLGDLGLLWFFPKKGIPRLNLDLVSVGGASFDHDAQLGTARLSADVQDEGTKKRTAVELSADLYRLGTMISVASGSEHHWISMRALTTELESSFEVFAEIAYAPVFREEDIERERNRLLSELAFEEKSPRALADLAIEASIFGSAHPYGRPVDGRRGTVATIKRDDLLSHHASVTQHRPTLVVVGDADVDQVTKLAETLFSRRVKSAPLALSEVPTIDPPKGRVTLIARAGSPQSTIRVGLQTISRTSPDYYPLVLSNAILGGQFVSRLNASLREKHGLTYGVRSSLALRVHAGSMVISGDFTGTETRKALDLILGELYALPNVRPITQNELDFIKTYTTRRFSSRFETSDGILNHLSHLAAYHLPADYYDHYQERIEGVTLAEIHRVCGDQVRPSAVHIVVVSEPTVCRQLAGSFEARPIEFVEIAS